MTRLLQLTLVFIILFASLPAFPTVAMSQANVCEDGTQSSGAIYRICMPPTWNDDLVIYAHGYVEPNLPVGIPEDHLRLPDGTYLPDIVNRLDYAFATTSYSKNGLAVRQGIEDVLDLAAIFREKYPQTRYIFLAGASEGGLVTTLAVEQYPDIFDGGLAACGPIGDFRQQTNYLGDFRVMFDYFFPGVLPSSPIDVPVELMENWETIYVPEIQSAITANPDATDQLLNVTDASIDLNNPPSKEETILQVLWYSAFATNDAMVTLGGQPFGNQHRVYIGSDHDLRLNRKVQRFRADAAALAEMATYYRPSGQLLSPLVTLHTTGDPVVPYWHTLLYSSKVVAKGSLTRYRHIPVLRYGHCNFETVEVLVSFALLVHKVTGQPPLNAQRVLPDAYTQAQYLQLAREQGVLP